MAAVLQPSSFIYQHIYYVHLKKPVCILWAELWSVRRTVTQLHSCEVQALGNGSQKWNGSPGIHGEVCIAVFAASGVNSLHGAQQRA